MILKDLTKIWANGSNYAILNLPFVCYSVQPHPRNSYEKSPHEHQFVVSFKSTLVFQQTLDASFDSIEEAKNACEKHLVILMKHVVIRLKKVIDFDTIILDSKQLALK
jgi:hypothetical protein